MAFGYGIGRSASRPYLLDKSAIVDYIQYSSLHSGSLLLGVVHRSSQASEIDACFR